MQTKIDIEDKVIDCMNCITGKTEELRFKGEKVMGITETEIKENDLPFIGPGLTDLQINGINGIDFNNNTCKCNPLFVNPGSYYVFANSNH
jgi:N-acetylglucosamine-6-phosphate deacetylase